MRTNPAIAMMICWVALMGEVGGGALAKTSDIRMTIEPDGVGFAGTVRAGSWTPVRVQLENRSGRARQVLCQWLLADADGDRVYAQRRVTLSPGRTQETFLYGVPTITTNPRTRWHVRVLDDRTRRVLQTQEIRPGRLVDVNTKVIGLTTVNTLGLAPYASRQSNQTNLGAITQHEPIHLITGVTASRLPDRWYGLELVDALVWTPGGGETDAGMTGAGLPPARSRALRAWIRRGGHLVVILPTVGDPWDQLPVDDLLPSLRIRRIRGVAPPLWLGIAATGPAVLIDAQTIEPADANDPRGDVLLRDALGRPLACAFRVGFGRITVVGVDLTDHRLARAGMPNGRGLWSAIFRWRSPAYSARYLEGELNERRIARPNARQHVMLDRFIPRLVAMRETASPALLAALITFGVYWLVAGPAGFAMLRARKLEHHSWVVFLGVVTVFSLLCWGGALAVRPTRANIAHFTVVDIHAHEPSARVRGWLSLFVPKHGRVAIELNGRAPGSTGPPSPGGQNTLASPGWDRAGGEATFVDTQWYLMDAGSPDTAEVPIRATAKSFEVDYLGPLADGYERDALITASSPLVVVDGWPTGTLVHHLPGTMKNVRVLYCPGGGAQPWVWQPKSLTAPSAVRSGEWAPGAPLILEPSPRALRLVQPGQLDTSPRQWKREGYLGYLIAAKTGQTWDAQAVGRNIVATNEVVQAIEMLSFYDTLPPPDFRNVQFIHRSANYDRSTARGLDLTGALSTRSLIVIGHLEKSGLAAPLTVDGRRIDSMGWTVIRWIYPLALKEES